MRVIHFIGFTGEEFWSAVKVWGQPHFIHRGWDMRAVREIGEDDLVIFANLAGLEPPRVKTFNDIDEQ